MARNIKLDETAAARLQKLAAADLLSVYSGRPGCACGCRGKWSYNAARRREAERSCGYRLIDSDVSARSLAIVLGKVKRLATDAAADEVEVGTIDGFGSEGFYAETPTRLYIVKTK